MKKSYFSLPVDFSGMFPKPDETDAARAKRTLILPKTTALRNSVDDFIELIITSRPGEFKSDNEFGFELWNIEFENLQIEKFNSHNFPRQDLEDYLQAKIQKYEPRLLNPKVEILFVHKKLFRGKKIKFFVEIAIHGTLDTINHEKYSKTFQFAMGPYFK